MGCDYSVSSMQEMHRSWLCAIIMLWYYLWTKGVSEGVGRKSGGTQETRDRGAGAWDQGTGEPLLLKPITKETESQMACPASFVRLVFL